MFKDQECLPWQDSEISLKHFSFNYPKFSLHAFVSYIWYQRLGSLFHIYLRTFKKLPLYSLLILRQLNQNLSIPILWFACRKQAVSTIWLTLLEQPSCLFAQQKLLVSQLKLSEVAGILLKWSWINPCRQLCSFVLVSWLATCMGTMWLSLACWETNSPLLLNLSHGVCVFHLGISN